MYDFELSQRYVPFDSLKWFWSWYA